MPTINRQVGASTDDAQRRLVSSTFSLTTDNIIVGAFSTSNYQYGGGMRFTNITIPQFAIIDHAYLRLRCSSSKNAVSVRSRISASDEDDAATFSTLGDFDTRWANRTTARINWDNIPAWTEGVDYNSPEIKTVIQEIVDREGWASGQDIVIFWDDFDDRSTHALERYRFAYSWNGSVAYAPKLVIDYTTIVTHERTFTDALALTDTLVKNPIKVLADSITLTDVLVKNPIKTFTDAIAFSDVWEGYKLRVFEFIDGIALSDTLVKSIAKVLTDGIAFTDTLWKVWTHKVIRVLKAVRNLGSIRQDEVER